MEGNLSDVGSPHPVPQIPAEYDDLYLQQGTYTSQRDFSHDINKRMKMPNRLSVDGKNLHDLEVENMRANTNSSHMATSAGMAIPDKITLAGPSQRDILEEPYGFMDTVTPDSSSYVNISTPPRVLTVDERFPMIQDESEEGKLSVSLSEEVASKIRTMDTGSSPAKHATHDLMQDHSLPGSLTIDSRVANLERQEQQRQTRDMLLYPAIVLYFSYKLIRWLMAS